MPPFAPAVRLATHDVSNQPPPFAGRNLFTSDRAFHDAALREGGDWLLRPLSELGREVGSEQVLELGHAANRQPPELVAFDRYGRRLDEVRFHPAYHQLMALAMSHRIHDFAWTAPGSGGHVAHLAMLALFTQAEAGVMCPINMTYAAVPVLRAHPKVGAPWLERLVGGRYDAPLGPIAGKAGVTLGMAMTEKQGGSDVRANTTRAEPLDAGRSIYRLTGHKWFCSAPMSDGFLTLAQAAGGLTCFLVPRITPDGERNAVRLMRLKDKLGNRSNASAEIEYENAYAERLGDEGDGVKTIIEMVHHTRLGTMGASLGIMRRALAEAVHHASHRTAFQKRLIDHPAMQAVIADLAVEYEAGVLLAMRTAGAFDARDEDDRAVARLLVALGKFWLTKRTPGFVYECMECLGGGGYVEESPLPRLFREAPLNAIWEGSGNVIALDILRTLRREPAALEGWRSETDAACAAEPRLARAREELMPSAAAAPDERSARWIAERMALVLQGALALRHAPAAVADAFISSRVGDHAPAMYGAGRLGSDVNAVLARQTN